MLGRVLPGFRRGAVRSLAFNPAATFVEPVAARVDGHDASSSRDPRFAVVPELSQRLPALVLGRFRPKLTIKLSLIGVDEHAEHGHSPIFGEKSQPDRMPGGVEWRGDLRRPSGEPYSSRGAFGFAAGEALTASAVVSFRTGLGHLRRTATNSTVSAAFTALAN